MVAALAGDSTIRSLLAIKNAVLIFRGGKAKDFWKQSAEWHIAIEYQTLAKILLA